MLNVEVEVEVSGNLNPVYQEKMTFCIGGSIKLASLGQLFLTFSTEPVIFVP